MIIILKENSYRTLMNLGTMEKVKIFIIKKKYNDNKSNNVK